MSDFLLIFRNHLDGWIGFNVRLPRKKGRTKHSYWGGWNPHDRRLSGIRELHAREPELVPLVVNRLLRGDFDNRKEFLESQPTVSLSRAIRNAVIYLESLQLDDAQSTIDDLSQYLGRRVKKKTRLPS